MSVISGTRRGMKELVDGTIRVQIDIDPIHRAEFFAAFSRIDMPVALAPLVANFEKIKPYEDKTTADLVPFADKPKGGELAKWAGIMSNDPVFWEWLDQSGYAFPFGLAANSLVRATWLIRNECGVDSRAELDHNPEAAKIFRNMMGQFSTWKDGGEAA